MSPTPEDRILSNTETPVRRSHDSTDSTLREDGTEGSDHTSGARFKSLDIEMGGIGNDFDSKAYKPRQSLWNKWFGRPVYNGAKQYLKVEQHKEEEDGLLFEADVARPGKVPKGKRKPSLNFRIYCGTVGSSIMYVVFPTVDSQLTLVTAPYYSSSILSSELRFFFDRREGTIHS